jgi:hypothetical protein
LRERSPVFLELPPPTRHDVAEVAARTAHAVERVLAKHGRELDDMQPVELEQPALASCLSASAHGFDLTGERAGKPTLRLVCTPPAPKTYPKPLPVAEVRGFNVHAVTTVNGADRNALERLCRYVARPPVANERLSILADGRVRYELKRTWADGTKAIVLEPLDLIARLCALVPPPWFNLTRYNGVLAPGSALRHEVVLRDTGRTSREHQVCMLEKEPVPTPVSRPHTNPTPARHPWAYLLKRTFRVDVTICPRCAGALRLVEIATEPMSIHRLLVRAGLAPMPPPVPPPLGGQLSLAL